MNGDPELQKQHKYLLKVDYRVFVQEQTQFNETLDMLLICLAELRTIHSLLSNLFK